MASITIGGFDFEIGHTYKYAVPAAQDIPKQLIEDIQDILADAKLPHISKDFNWVWVMVHGKDKFGNQGSLTKRIAGYYYKLDKSIVDPKVLSKIGQLVSLELKSESEVLFDLENNLELPSSYFYNTGSCLWGGQSSGRFFIMDQGGGAIRILSADNTPTGRCLFVPVTGASGGTALALFNNYKCNLFSVARMLSTISGLGYRKIRFSDSSGTIYVNKNNDCYAVGMKNDLISEMSTEGLSTDESEGYKVILCYSCNRYYPRNRVTSGVCTNCRRAEEMGS